MKKIFQVKNIFSITLIFSLATFFFTLAYSSETTPHIENGNEYLEEMYVPYYDSNYYDSNKVDTENDPSIINFEYEVFDLSQLSIPETIIEELEIYQLSLAEPPVARSFSLPMDSLQIRYSNVYYFGDENTIHSNTELRPRIGDWFQSFSGHLSFQGQQVIVRPITVFNGEVLHAELQAPNVSTIDYGLILVEVFPDNTIHPVPLDFSLYPTLINGAHGTLRESVGIVNNSGRTRQFGIIIEAVRGFSATLPFTLHVGINMNSDPFEADQNTRLAIPLNLRMGVINQISSRSLITRADNDWYRIVIPSQTPSIVALTLNLDPRSVSAGHTVELYTLSNTNQARRINIDSSGRAVVSSGVHYIRVSANQRPIFGQSYVLSMTPVLDAPASIEITSLASPDFHPNFTLAGHTFPRIRAARTLTVNGTARRSDGSLMANTRINLEVFNFGWDNWNASLFHQRLTMK